MTSVRVYVDGDRAGPLFQRATSRWGAEVHSTARRAATAAAQDIETRGRADIRAAGRFGSRWTDGLTATVTSGGGNVRIDVREAVPYWRVFQYGAIIRGRPLLWIPLSFAVDAQGVSARDFPGRLFRVDRRSGGAPLLLSSGDGQPKYFGKESVTIPKKFHIVEIARESARRLREFYAAARGV